MRELKHHEKKLLRKVNIVGWKGERNIRVAKILRRYHIQNREDYVGYERMCGMITSLSAKLKSLPSSSPFRIDLTQQLLDKLYNIGVVDSKSNLEKADKISVSGFCRRRLPVVMVRLKMSQTLPSAITLIETGQVRLGPTVVTDPSMLVTRNMEDFVGWTEEGKINRTVKK
eukprot:CAMPEP_0118658118 /NCGR_PEP_ID=MMETSP0785-20121206/14390_1 /TAXON_ID=91992 /ORGANISM="Bolidomonas pacifica, Strain CCMP 1866" /LENGTH=170 /DNA_ID=CAMNT_0006551099 /DNA_START=187 /DNA_END=696 /DNA_ORIENTATION=-